MTISWLKDPLLQFTVAGTALFAAYAFVERPAPETVGKAHVVRIGSGEADWLRQGWTRQWGRPPTDAELRGLLRDRLREELLAREAVALGLQDGDTVVRRRLAQKMEFIVDDATAIAEPTDADLRRTFEAHRQRFDPPARISFTQIYFSPARRGARASADASAVAARLRGDVPRAALDAGDPTILPASVVEQDETSVAAQFGPQFAQSAFAAAKGIWQGPIESAFGVHVVRVSEKRASATADFAEVRDAVAAVWSDERRRASRDAYFGSLMKKYDVTVDPAMAPYFEGDAVRLAADR